MTELLFLRMDDSPDRATMLLLNGDGQLMAQPESVPLTIAAERAGSMPVTVLLPAREIVCCLASVPAASPARLRQMLPFSLEDDFASDIEELQFAPGERNEADAVPVSVMSRERLRFWLSAVRSAGVDPRRLVSEADGVADTPGTVTLYLEGSSILGRRPGGAPFFFDELTLAELWQLLETEADDNDDLANVVLFVDPQTRAARQAEIDAWRIGIGHLEIRELADGCFPRLASRLALQPGQNLLQGEFATRSDIAALARPWRVAAGFLLTLIVFSVIGKSAEVWKLGRDDVLLEQQAGTICAESYSSRQLPSCAGEMERRLASASRGSIISGTGFLDFLAAVGAAAGDQMQVQELSYRNNEMTLELVVPTVEHLQYFVDTVTGAGPFDVRPGSTESAEGGGIEARVEIVLR